MEVIDKLRQLPVEERTTLIRSLSEEEAYVLLNCWEFWARPEQLTPRGTWNIWLILAGRGWGKTKTAAEDVKSYGLAHAKSRIAVVAPTYADARDTCIEGESGLLSILPRDKVMAWNRSLGELFLTNGTRYKLFSADEPERLRGPQHHRAWYDEICASKYPDQTWDMLMFGLRLGLHPQAVVTTTPKPIPLIRQLIQRDDVHITRGSTFDNADNLASSALAQLRYRYLGTKIGRQELLGELIEDNEGALWRREAMIEALRVSQAPSLKRIVVAIDPQSSNNENSAETGIVIAGVGMNGHGYVIADRSKQTSPENWATIAINAYHEYQCDRIVAEVNNGGAMVEAVIRNVAKDMGMNVAYKAVTASRSKQLRAEPVSALYERGLVHHVGMFPQLEDQQCQWVPGEKSPDRLDAVVWALTELMVGKISAGGMMMQDMKDEDDGSEDVEDGQESKTLEGYEAFIGTRAI